MKGVDLRALFTIAATLLLLTAVSFADEPAEPQPEPEPPVADVTVEEGEAEPPAESEPEPADDPVDERQAELEAALAAPHTCYISGEPWNDSPTRVMAVFRDFNQLKRAYFLNLGYLIVALEEFREANADLHLVKVYVLDYSTAGTDSERLIELDDQHGNAWFVWSDKKIKGTRPPYVVAFGTEQAAEDFAKKHGKKAYSFDTVIEKLAGQMKKP